uniref:Uncharacterized protein n=1 Tax=Hucho hucho TaxID=62062 RepID=A0A4W5LWQ2_9TELE
MVISLSSPPFSSVSLLRLAFSSPLLPLSLSSLSPLFPLSPPLPSSPSFSSLLSRSSEQQQRFHEICGNLVKTQRRILGWWKRLFSLKEEKPKMYFASVISSLVAVAWMGQQVHNLFLTYLIGTYQHLTYLPVPHRPTYLYPTDLPTCARTLPTRSLKTLPTHL